MLRNFLKGGQIGRQSLRSVNSCTTPLLMGRPTMLVAMRAFGHTKYSFDDEDWKPN